MKFTSHKQYLFGHLFSIKVKEESYRPKYTSSLLICQKSSKVAAGKNFFSIVYVIDATCFDEYFLFHVIPGKRYFFKKFVVTARFFQPPYCRFI